METAKSIRGTAFPAQADTRVDAMQFLQMFTEIFKRTDDDSRPASGKTFTQNSCAGKAVRQHREIRLALKTPRHDLLPE